VNVVLEFDNIESIKQSVESVRGAILPQPTLDREVQSGILAACRSKQKDIPAAGIIHRGRKFSPA